MAASDFEDGIHLAAYARVVDRHDGFCAGRDQPLQQRLVQVQGVRPDIDENGLGASQRKCAGRGDEGEGRKDHLIAGLHIQQQGRHLQGVRARGRQQHLWRAQHFLEERMAQLGEAAIPADMHLIDGLLNVSEFRAGLTKPAERNVGRIRLRHGCGRPHRMLAA